MAITPVHQRLEYSFMTLSVKAAVETHISRNKACGFEFTL